MESDRIELTDGLDPQKDPTKSDCESDLCLEALAHKLSLAAQISAALFVSSKPLSLRELSKATHRSESEVEQAMSSVMELYQEDVHGFSLHKILGGYQLRTSSGAREVIREIQPARVKRFSRAAAETLAVIAYKQPVQRAEIEAIRGVDALPTLKTLLEAKVIRMIGRDDEVGKPALYATTEHFLERFGLNSLSDLPTLREMREMEGDPGENTESANPDDQDIADQQAAQ